VDALAEQVPAASLVITVTCGAEQPERCSQGLTVAATAVAAGVPVSLWLTGEAVRLAVRGAEGFVLEHAADPVELLGVVAAEGAVTVCTQCAARRDLVEADLVDGTRIAGAAVLVDEVMRPGARALVY
jgi:predicted peroxiredoxin